MLLFLKVNSIIYIYVLIYKSKTMWWVDLSTADDKLKHLMWFYNNFEKRKNSEIISEDNK